MAQNNLANPIFQDDDKAREWLEAQIWPDGPVCPHCGSFDVTPLKGKAHRPGVHQCNEKECRQQFTVTVGTLFERSKIPLSKWLMATYLLSASKKGMSTRQLSRMLGVSVKSSWFMMHRIREAMREGKAGPLGGQNKVVEADETWIGGKAKNRAFAPPPKKEPVVALVERDGSVRSFHVESVSARTLRPILFTQIDRASFLMTDESKVYTKSGREFSGHATVNHSINEYVRGNFYHSNTVENYFSILKRGITGNYQWVSDIESSLSTIFLRLIFAGNSGAASAAFYAAVNFNVKLSMVDAAAHIALSPQRLKRWARLHKEASRLVGKRNDMVHFQCDSDDSLPEGKRHTLTPNFLDDGSRKRFRGNNRPSYNLTDVQKIQADFRVLQIELRKFSTSLRTLKPKRSQLPPALKSYQKKASDKKVSQNPKARSKRPRSSRA